MGGIDTSLPPPSLRSRFPPGWLRTALAGMARCRHAVPFHPLEVGPTRVGVEVDWSFVM